MKNEVDKSQEHLCWEEMTSATLIARIRRSEWAASCFIDVKYWGN